MRRLADQLFVSRPDHFRCFLDNPPLRRRWQQHPQVPLQPRSPTRFTKLYTFGDFKGNPARIIEKYFDAYLYLANWGTRKFTLRLPRQGLDLGRVRLYCAGESASVRAKGQFVILDFCSEEEGGDWEEEGQGWLSSLIPLRADIAGGDYRAL